MPKFSTSGKQEIAIMNVTLMDAMKHYFKYFCTAVGCGIPKVKLMGTLEDWEEIRKRAEKIEQYELEWWT